MENLREKYHRVSELYELLTRNVKTNKGKKPYEDLLSLLLEFGYTEKQIMEDLRKVAPDLECISDIEDYIEANKGKIEDLYPRLLGKYLSYAFYIRIHCLENLFKNQFEVNSENYFDNFFIENTDLVKELESQTNVMIEVTKDKIEIYGRYRDVQKCILFIGK